MGVGNAARWVEEKIGALSRFLGIIAIGILLAMMLFTVVNVFLRAVFNRPIPGDVELIEIAMVCTSFLGLAWCAIKEKHIRVDLLVASFPKRAQAIIDGVGYGAALVTCIVISWQSVVEGIANREINRLSASLGIPVYPFYWVTALGFAVLCMALLVLIARAVRKAADK